MLGSFIVQLFGLVTPLFTQVILDKVIVHRTFTTLDVLAFGFIAVMIFEVILNVSRKYIFVHTASKIDAKLGSKLFKHLFALPFTYFENRKVGNIIARVRELDQIRDFITNKSVSGIIDLFFSVVFVLMMLLYSVKLTFIVLGFVSLIAILYLLVTPELRARLEKKFQMGAQSNSYLVESVTGIQTVKSLAIEGSMQKKWEKVLEIFNKIHLSDSMLNVTKNCFIAEVEKQNKFADEKIASLDNEIKKNKARLEKLFNLYLDGKVEESLYHKKSAELESFLDDLILTRGAYTKVSVELLKYSESLFELFKMSATIYFRLNNSKKRELLKMLCSNFSYDGENVIITIKKAFEPIVQIAYLEKMEVGVQS